jgi:DNA segregation ATPase FtsK/SpoIIIE, S-DNA-T family
MKKEHINEIKGVIVLALGLILLASLISFVPEDLPWYTSNPNVPAKNLIRVVGAYMAGSLLFVFGYSSYFLVVFMFFWSWNKFVSRQLFFTFSKFVSCVILFCVISSLFSMTGPAEVSSRFGRGGLVGYVWAEFLMRYLGRTGAYIILGTLGTLTLIITGEVLVSPLLFRITEVFQELWGSLKDRLSARGERVMTPRLKPAVKPLKTKELPKSFADRPENRIIQKEVNALKELTKKILPQSPATPPASNRTAPAATTGDKFPPKPAGAGEKPQIRITDPAKEEAPVRNLEPKVVGNYTVPTLELLSDPPAVSSQKLQSDLEQGARILEETLADFGVTVRVADIERGPVITRYELEPAPGVKVQKITTLSDDIALAMKAQTVRIVAPIPGKNRVGIEVPNGSIASVYLKDVLSQSQFSTSPKLTLAIGKDISGKPLIANLAEMPHLLIAGTTGAGKTVCVNSIIMSMLFNASPDEVKFLMVDPKMVELAQYNSIPHMLCPAVTDYKKVSNALNWIVSEMESRYGLLSKAGVRNIAGYHAKGLQMPYIVVIIDELADLMQVAAKTIESAITRLAQLSRAVGIHLILATQRPSVDVITGVIKANFPARISFKVASKVDSRTVLDMNGAENLLGKGDLLFMKPGDAKPTRGQCSFVTDQEIDRVIQFIKKQQEPTYDETILKQQTSGGAGGSDEKDELYDEALKLVLETNQASVSILQRRMRLGYTRAARLIDMMEQNGIVGPYCGSKPRDILINREEWLLGNMKNANPDANKEA